MRRKSKGVIEAAMRNKNIVIMIAIVFMIIGVVALKKMPRNEFPQFTIRKGVIVGVYPGATSAEVEAQLTRVVENYIYGYKEVKKAKTYSQSKEGIMYIFVELNDDVKDADEFWSKLKHGLNELKMTLPSGVLALVANSDFGDTSALLITLSSETKSYKDLEESLKKLEAECRKIKATSKIKHFGLQKEKIYVNVKPELLNEYNIKTLSLLGAYQLNGMVNYAGELKDSNYNYAVHLPANFESEEDLENQIVYSDLNGNVVRLKNIATIDRRYEDPDSYIKQNGKKTILLSLEMQPGNNIVEYGKDVDKALAVFEKNCPKDITVAKISELPKYVDDSVSDFMKEFIIAIVAVILVTMILLPLRVASVAGITVPISVLITLAFLYFFGIELHTVSLASLILVLGMIVDNSIVVIDNHVEKMDHGMSRWHASVQSAKELFTPILTATLAIFIAYLPLGFMVPGTAGEFLMTIPIVVGIALTISVAVAVLLVPYMNYALIKKGLKRTNHSKKRRSFLEILQKWFDKALEKAFHYPKTAILTGIATIAIAVIIFKGIDQQLFPEMERNQFAVEVYLPTGSSLKSTAKIVDSIESVLMKDKRVTNVTSFIGTSSPRFHTVYAPHMPEPNYGQLLINTVSDKATREVVNKYRAMYADNFPDVHIKWKTLALQNYDSPVEVRISSDSVKDIRKVEKQVDSILKKTPNLGWVRDDWDQMQQNIKVNINRDKANRMGYSKGFVATSLMVGLDGLPLTTIWEGDYPVEVRLTQENKAKKSISSLGDEYISSLATLSSAPLRSFASLSPEWTEGTIVRRNGVPTLTIHVDNDSVSTATSMFEAIKPQVDKLNLPEGTSINYGGEDEGQKEVFTPMTIALALSILLIFFILVFQFKKGKLSILIMLTMLLTLPGAAIGLKLMGYPFSITAFVGISSLCGMVVRNGIILIDYACKLRENTKMTVRQSALAAGKRRMRPIFLTSAAAAVGVIPMILSRSSLWGPLGTVICFGLLTSMVLTLFILPIMYWLVYRKEDKKLPAKGGSISGVLKPIAVTIVLLIGFAQFSTAQTSYTLEQCKKLALENNAKVKDRTFGVDISKQIKKAAFTKYFPNISATGLTARFHNNLLNFDLPGGNLPVYNGNPMTIPFATEFAYFPGFSISMLDKMSMGNIMATQPVFAGGRIYYGNKLAQLGINVSNEKLTMSKNEVLLKTEGKYWLVVSLNEKMKTIEMYSRLLDSLYKNVNNSYKAGLIKHNDVLKVSLKQSELQMNKLKLENGRKLATMSLCQYIGVKYDSSLVLSDTAKSISLPANLYTNHKEALQRRVEYKLMQESVKAEKLQTKIKRGEYLPQIAVGAGALTYNYDKSTEWSNNTMVFGTVTIPISDWWEASHTLKERNLIEKVAQNDADSTSEILMLQMEKTWTDLQEAYQQIQLAEEAIKLSEENLKITNDNYKAGIVSITDLLEAQAILQSSYNSLTEARCNYQITIAEYLQVTGNY